MPTADTRHKITVLPLAALKRSALNVRKHGEKDIATLAAMIRAQGLLQPLVVRKGDEAYEVIAGGRRLKALEQIGREDGETPPVPCVVIGSCDDATAIEASLAENIARLPMDEIDQYTAFAALVRQGRSEDDIAEQFGITPLVVKRRLALARLIPDIHRLYRDGDIDAETLRLLTLASRERQKAYVALALDPDQNPPPKWQLKAWLLGGAEIDTRHALFDEATYSGDISGDLFGEARYFTDAEQFWRLQNEAITTLKADLAAKGWAEVHVVGPDQHFYPHQWQEVRKSDGGHAVIEVKATGEVEVHKGLLSPDEARMAERRRSKAAADDTGLTNDERIADGAEVSSRPELSGPLANYVDLVRLSTVKAALLKSPKVALRILALRFLAQAEHVSVKREAMQAAVTATHSMVKGLVSETACEAARSKVCALLDLASDDPLTGTGRDEQRPRVLFAKLMTLSDAQVMHIIAVCAADTLALGSVLVDDLGAVLKADCLDHWQPDDALLDLVRDREVTGALLADVIGDEAAASYLTETGSKKKEIIRNALAGTSRSKAERWQPRWLAFPQGRYTKRPLMGRTPPAA